jgi:hypothetical protein
VLIDGTPERKLMLAFILPTYAPTPPYTPSSNHSLRDILALGF